MLSQRALKIRWIAITATLFALAVVPAMYWSDVRLALYPVFLVSAALLVMHSNATERDHFVVIASKFMLILLIGAVIGYLLAAYGVQPLFTFNNTDGRPNYFFYTTLTNVYEADFIRPSGIYDEPGAFSFFVCLTAYLREATGKSRPMTFALLLLGLITFSITHLIFFAIFILTSQAGRLKLIQFAVAFSLLMAAVLASGGGQVIEDRFLSRLALTDEGTIAGDTRTLLFLNAAVVLFTSDHAALVGADSDCTLNKESCVEKFGPMGENLLSPLVSQGVFISWPYYLFLVLGLVSLTQGRRGLLFFAVALLYVQRPYLLNLGYSVTAILALYAYFAFASAPQRKAGHRQRARPPLKTLRE